MLDAETGAVGSEVLILSQEAETFSTANSSGMLLQDDGTVFMALTQSTQSFNSHRMRIASYDSK